jgi:general stress protein 26
MTPSTTADPIPELDERFSEPEASPRPWSEVLAVIEAAEISWLSTVRADGRPHVTPLPVFWLDGALHFCTGPGEQKARNLAHDPRCAITTGTDRFRSGLDVVVEGTARRVTDTDVLHRLTPLWREKLDWEFDVVPGEGFVDPGGADVAHVFAVTPAKVLAFGKGEPYSQTRYRTS